MSFKPLTNEAIAVFTESGRSRITHPTPRAPATSTRWFGWQIGGRCTAGATVETAPAGGALTCGAGALTRHGCGATGQVRA